MDENTTPRWVRIMAVTGLLLLLAGSILFFVGDKSKTASVSLIAVGMLVLYGLHKRMPIATGTGESVLIDEKGVRRSWAGKEEYVAWKDLTKVTIVTTADGPYAEDFFFLLHAADGTGCVVSNEQACKIDLVAHLQRLPGFDNMALIEATGSTDETIFLCWDGKPGDGLKAA